MLMSTTVLSQIQTIEAELTAQESQLSAQLEAVREKLTGIRAVMPMFTDISASAKSSAKESIAKKSLSKKQKIAQITADFKKPAEKSAEKPAAAKSKSTKVKATKKTKATTPKSLTQKTDGRAADWQKYTRPGVKNQSMPDAVRLILETQPENNFKIVDVMEALFKENMPKAQYLKARNRISNVLSGGVRAGDWHKGERGTYRMTAA